MVIRLRELYCVRTKSNGRERDVIKLRKLDLVLFQEMSTFLTRI